MKTVDIIQSNKENRKPTKPLRVAAYCRVSTEHDGQDGSIEARSFTSFK